MNAQRDAGVIRENADERRGGRFVYLPAWYRTTRGAISHLFEQLGSKSVEGKCGHYALAASLVVEDQRQERCTECLQRAPA